MQKIADIMASSFHTCTEPEAILTILDIEYSKYQLLYVTAHFIFLCSKPITTSIDFYPFFYKLYIGSYELVYG